MLFSGSEFVKLLNLGKEFKISYLTGYDLNDEDAFKNILQSYTVISAIKDLIKIQLNFS